MAYKIKNMVEDHILAEEVKEEKSKFINPGGSTQDGIFELKFAPEGSEYKPGQLVLLRPDTYPGLFFEGVSYTKLREEDIIAIVERKK